MEPATLSHLIVTLAMRCGAASMLLFFVSIFGLFILADTVDSHSSRTARAFCAAFRMLVPLSGTAFVLSALALIFTL